MRARGFLLLPLVLVAGACGAPGQGEATQDDLKGLRDELRQVARERDTLETRVATAERRIAGLQEDLMRLHEMRGEVPAAAASTEAGAEAALVESQSGGAAAAALPPNQAEIARFLQSEEGAKVLDATLRAVEDRRAAERMTRVVEGALERFAQQANLDAAEERRMQEIMTRSMGAMRGVWTSMRETPAATEAERAALRQENVAKVEEIRSKADQEVKAVLSSSQYQLYEQEQERLRGFLRGPGMGGDGGGFRRQ